MKYVLGIDQGGTKTAVALMDENGKICGTGYEKGAYFPEHGIDYAVSRIEHAICQAVKEAGANEVEIERAVAGITGIDWPGDDEFVKKALERLVKTKEIQVYNDSVIAMHGGTLSDYGVVICAGTGLNAAICKKNGECFVFGDYLGGNLQGGTALAHRGARKVFDAELGLCEAGELKKLFLKFAEVDNVDKLLRRYMQDEKFQEQLRLIVPDMVKLAESGDEATDGLLYEFAEELSTYIIAGLKNADMLEEPIDIVLAGSVFKGRENPLTKYLIQKMQKAAPRGRVLCAKYEPVVGACIMGVIQRQSFTEEMNQNLADSARRLSLLRD